MKTTATFIIGVISFINAEVCTQNATNPCVPYVPKESYGLDVNAFFLWMACLTAGLCAGYQAVKIWPNFFIGQRNNIDNQRDIENNLPAESQQLSMN